MIKANPTRLSTLAMIAFFGTTGCPSNDNNTAENNFSDVGADVLSDQGQDTGVDSTDTNTDTGETIAGCILLNASPRTLPLGGEPARITWSLSCEQPIDPAALELIAPRELAMELEIPEVGLCQPAENGHVCTFSASGLVSPGTESPIHNELFEVVYGPEKRLRSDVRWHYTPEALNRNFALPIIEREAAQITGGLGTTFYKRRRPFQERLRAVYREKLRNVELNVIPPDGGNSTTTVEVPVVWDDLLGQNMESMNSSDGTTTETLWWGYDGKAKRFIGAALATDDDGNETYNQAYDSSPPLEGGTDPVTILDARALRIQRPATMGAEESEGVTVFVVGLNTAGNVVFHIPFGEQSTSREFTTGTFFGLDESKLTSKTFGFVKQLGNVEDFFSNTNDDFFLIWSALPNATKDKLNVTIFPSFSAGEPTAVATELDTGFEVIDTYVSQSTPGTIIVLAHGADNARAMYRLNYVTVTDPETGDETSSVTGHVQLELPANVDVRPSSCHTPKKDTPKQVGSWECKDSILTCSGELCGSTTHLRTVGRWPWNWRGIKDVRSQASQPMVLEWNDDGSLNSLFPLVVEKTSAEFKEGAPIIVSELNSDRAAAIHTTSFSSEACANPEDCFVQVADSVLMGPGTNAPTFYIQGDDGLKKVREGHGGISANRSNRGGGRERQKQNDNDRRRRKRVIAPVIPGTSTVATHVLMDLETTPDGSDTVNSVQLNITINDSPLDPNLVLHEVISDFVDDTEELVLIFEPLVVAEGADTKMTVISISGSEIEAALAEPDKIATIKTSGAPLEFQVASNGFGVSSLQVSLRSQPRRAAAVGGNVTTQTLTKEAANGILIVYTSAKTGELVVGNLSKKDGAYVHTEQSVIVVPTGGVVVRGHAFKAKLSSGLMVSSSPNGATFISVRELSSGLSVLDIGTRPFATPLSDSSFDAATYNEGDFNGDGISDLHVSPNFSMLPPSTVLSADDVACPGCLIYFGDGLGGFLDTSMDVPGGPWMEWGVDSGIEGLAAGFGKGTKKSTTKASSRAELQ